eukprot:scaffold45655_cov72-Phaeocystis_antarctica.AAC.3
MPGGTLGRETAGTLLVISQHGVKNNLPLDPRFSDVFLPLISDGPPKADSHYRPHPFGVVSAGRGHISVRFCSVLGRASLIAPGGGDDQYGGPRLRPCVSLSVCGARASYWPWVAAALRAACCPRMRSRLVGVG